VGRSSSQDHEHFSKADICRDRDGNLREVGSRRHSTRAARLWMRVAQCGRGSPSWEERRSGAIWRAIRHPDQGDRHGFQRSPLAVKLGSEACISRSRNWRADSRRRVEPVRPLLAKRMLRDAGMTAKVMYRPSSRTLPRWFGRSRLCRIFTNQGVIAATGWRSCLRRARLERVQCRASEAMDFGGRRMPDLARSRCTRSRSCSQVGELS